MSGDGARMRIVVGCRPEPRGQDALALGTLLARQLGAGVVLAHIQPPALPGAGVGAVDAEWRAFLREETEWLLNDAESRIRDWAPELPVERAIGHNRGSGRGLARIAESHRAALVVLGPAPGGRTARVALGSTADQLLHGSPVPVALAPRGFADHPPPRIARCTIAYQREPQLTGVLTCGVEFARRLDADVRLLTLVLRPVRLYSGKQHQSAEHQVLRAAREQARQDLATAMAEIDVSVDAETAEGDDVRAAMDTVTWADDLLICASSTVGPVKRVFVGDVSHKIVRNARTPVMVLPRGVRAELWDTSGPT
ncbi:universal stress protein [Embleya sp. NBC_00888]|uniref:universal stress protein n=1 Tax=Embleya sp. NBC_00888 TaxID=2975960 RepID=UPI003870BC95|nr:universal stress protein [Embleya sp. NBC_00888]